MDVILLLLFAIVLCIGGLIGCFVPVIPGPPIAWLGLLIIYLATDLPITGTEFSIYTVLMVVTVILDYVIPMLGVRFFGGTKYGKWGSFLGTILGLFILPWGLFIGPFIGAIIGELMGESTGMTALKSGFASLFGFLFGVLLKFIVCVYFLVIAVMAIVKVVTIYYT